MKTKFGYFSLINNKTFKNQRAYKEHGIFAIDVH